MTKPVILEIQKALALEYQTKYKWASGIGHWGRTICVSCQHSGRGSYVNGPKCNANIEWVTGWGESLRYDTPRHPKNHIICPMWQKENYDEESN